MSAEEFLAAAQERDAHTPVALSADDVRAAIADLLDRCTTADTPEACAAVWLGLEAILDDARRARDEAGEWTAKVMDSAGDYRTDVNGTRIVVSKPKSRTAWQWDDVWPELRKIVTEEPRLLFGTGEPEGDVELALRVVKDCVSVSSVKVGGFKKRGRDVDEFCRVTEKPATVKVEHL